MTEEPKEPPRRALDPSEQRAHDIAAQIALTELVRVILAEAFFHEDPATFRHMLQVIERAAVDGVSRRDMFPGADERTTTFIKEAAAQHITGIITSIRHPAENAGGDRRQGGRED